MTRLKLLRTVALGLCLSAFYTGIAYAQTGGTSTPPSKGIAQSAEDSALFDKQSKIDQYIFTDHTKDIEEKGFSVIYTGVADNYVEIGISPFSKGNAKYLYDIFGTDGVKVVESQDVSTYTTTTAEAGVGTASSGVAVPNGTVTSNDAATTPSSSAGSDAQDATSSIAKGAPDTPVSGGTAKSDVIISAPIKKADAAATRSNPETTVTSNTTEPAVTAQGAVKNTGSDNQTLDKSAKEEIQTVSATEMNANSDINNTSKANDDINAPVIVLAIAGGAIIIGGAATAVSKKKIVK